MSEVIVYEIQDEDYSPTTLSPSHPKIIHANQNMRLLPFVRCNQVLHFQSPNKYPRQRRANTQVKILREMRYLVNSTEITKEKKTEDKNFVNPFELIPDEIHLEKQVEKNTQKKEYQLGLQEEKQLRRIRRLIAEQDEIIKLYERQIKRSEKNREMMGKMVNQEKVKPKQELICLVFFLILLCKNL